MHDLNRGWGLAWVAALSLAALALVGCGSASSGSGDANTLLTQTFSGKHQVKSGSVNFGLTVQPSGSSTLKGPITFSFGGPFQSRGAGRLPASNFTVSLGGNGKTASLAVLSTGTAGYVMFKGASYQLPQATFQKLEGNFAQVTSSSGGSRTGTLGKLGIQPLSWLRNPAVVGNESVGGADTTHIHAGVNVSAFVNDLSTFLSKAASLGVSGAGQFSGGLPASARSQLASAIRNPSVDVWTGSDDKTLRKLQISLTVPVSGQLSTAAGGLTAAGIGLTFQYGSLNQPQTITAPSNVRPFSEFAGQLRSFTQALQSASGVSGSTGSSGSAGSAGGSGSAAAVQSYSQCIQAAGSDVSKMQQCASLLSGK